MENLENIEIEETQTIFEVTEENMFAFVKNGIIEYYWPLDEYNEKFEWLKIKKSEIDFEKYNSWFDIFEENWKIVYKKSERFEILKKEKEKMELEILKNESLQKFKTLKEKAEKLRLEYLTAELLPAWPNRTVLLEKLEENRQVIAEKVDKMLTEFREKFWENILELLI